jgi:hypothetical protein
MSSHFPTEKLPPLDLGPWRRVPNLLVIVGAVLVGLGAVASYARHGDLKQLGYSWLVAFMFCLTICLGALFMVLVHHLSDAGWSVSMRRFCEHLAGLLFPWMAVMFIPVALLAKQIYSWTTMNPAARVLHVKLPVFTMPGFYIFAAVCFALWGVLTHGLRKWSLKQDETGAAECTYKMRRYSAWGIYVFGITLTAVAFFWVMALEPQWFSAVYGVYFFGSTVWVGLATIYFITLVLARAGILRDVIHKHQFYYLGTLLMAFTVFQAYIGYSQYFVVWNANMPVENFWYLQREQGSWWWVSMLLIFGHFLVPFLLLLPIAAKENFKLMVPLICWAWLMHYFDMSFNITPALHHKGYPFQWAWLDFGCLALMIGVLSKIFIARLSLYPAYPVKDPRLGEIIGQRHPLPTGISGGEIGQVETDDAAELQPSGGNP